MKLSLFVIPAVVLALAGCAAEPVDEDAASSEGAATARAATDRSRTSYTSDEVWIFGGEDADVALGCVTCSSYSRDSLANEYSRYASEYGDTIYNSYGKYGSEYSSYSPWNDYASSPPKLYSKDKSTYYGLFTVDEYKSGRTHLDAAIEILEKGRDR